MGSYCLSGFHISRAESEGNMESRQVPHSNVDEESKAIATVVAVNQGFDSTEEPYTRNRAFVCSDSTGRSWRKHTCSIIGTDTCKKCLWTSNLNGLYDKNCNHLLREHWGDDTAVISLQSILLADLNVQSGRKLQKPLSAPSSIRLAKKEQVTKGQGFDDNWKINLDQFKRKRKIIESERNLQKSTRSYYKHQLGLIESYHSLSSSDNDKADAQKAADLLKRAAFYSKLTFFANFLLLVAKSTAAGLSGSISIITSLVDSVVDLVSGIVLWLTARAIRNCNPYSYPDGRSRLEPLAIVVLSAIMGVASLQLIKESVTKIVGLADGSMRPPVVDMVTIAISVATILVKFGLFMLCRRVKSPTIQTLAQDHRNDVVSNTVAIVCGYVGSADFRQKTTCTSFAYVDPVGAIVISLYIAVTWYMLGKVQVRMITGHTARPDVLSKIIWVCLNHHRAIRYVTSVKAVYSGYTFVVEVSILLPADMSLKDAHKIGESLEKVLEGTPYVDRACVRVTCTEDDDWSVIDTYL